MSRLLVKSRGVFGLQTEPGEEALQVVVRRVASRSLLASPSDESAISFCLRMRRGTDRL